MVPKQPEGDTQDPVVGNLATAGLPPVSRHPFFGAADRRADEGYHQSGPISVGKAVISMGVIDEKSLTRECITTSLLALDARLHKCHSQRVTIVSNTWEVTTSFFIMHVRPWQVGTITTNNSFHSKNC